MAKGFAKMFHEPYLNFEQKRYIPEFNKILHSYSRKKEYCMILTLTKEWLSLISKSYTRNLRH